VAAPHLVHVFSTFVPAGPQVRVAKLLAAFGPRFRHSILAMDGRLEARALVDANAEVRYLEAPPKAGSLSTTRRMRSLLARERPDLVLTYNFGALDSVFAARSLGLRVVHHEDGFLPDEARGFKKRRIWLRRAAFGKRVEVVVISRNLERIARELWRVPAQRLHYIANGIEIERFPERDGNAELRARLGIPATALVVGAVGHLRPEKKLQRLFDAAELAAREVDLHLLLLGDGPERAELERRAGAPPLAGRVHFAGYQQDPREFYRAMDVFALTSDTEQMPIALLEAMASALPAAATDVGDVRAMLGPDQGRFVAQLGGPECSAALAHSLVELGLDAALRARLGASNRFRCQSEYEHSAMAAAYLALYESACAPRAAK
jgi:glycosyltransferase involved in cell wall biosynthesis